VLVDTFLFYNEYDLLELRLLELSPLVDRFVVVEATVTFSGKEKPLYFREAASRYAEWAHRLVHVVVEDTPETDDAWQREIFQRNAIVRGLTEIPADALVLLSDVDELPRTARIPASVPAGMLIGFEHRQHLYALNCRTDASEVRTKVATAATLRRLTPQVVRDAGRWRPYQPMLTLADAGWHFGYLGGVEAIRDKLGAFSHRELDKPPYTDRDYIARCISSTCDFYDGARQLEVFAVDDSLPRVVQAEPERWKRHLLPA